MNRGGERGDRPPWDPANGLRVGLVAGALIGAAIVVVADFPAFSIIVVCATMGGAVGYWRERRNQPDR